jgi:hypothetical protein
LIIPKPDKQEGVNYRSGHTSTEDTSQIEVQTKPSGVGSYLNIPGPGGYYWRFKTIKKYSKSGEIGYIMPDNQIAGTVFKRGIRLISGRSINDLFLLSDNGEISSAVKNLTIESKIELKGYQLRLEKFIIGETEVAPQSNWNKAKFIYITKIEINGMVYSDKTQ